MPLMFLSYRRSDTAAIARRIYDSLEREFGQDSVFMDIDTIEGGRDFHERLEAALQESHVLLALIGPGWLAGGRLHEPEDFVRLEIERAIGRGVPLMPVLVDGTSMPKESELPSSIRPMVRQQALRVESGEAFADRMDRVVRDLKELLGTRLVSGEPLLHDEKMKLETVVDDEIDDLAFTIMPEEGTPFDEIGFRLSTAEHGSFFCITRDDKLVVTDRDGHSIESSHTMGSRLADGRAFYSIDLQWAKSAIPAHALVGLRLRDLETATIDFMARRGAVSKRRVSYGVAFVAALSNWMVSCGSFNLTDIGQATPFLVFEDFLAVSPFAEPLELRVLSEQHARPAGEDLEDRALDGMLEVIRAEMEGNEAVMQVVRLPDSPAHSCRLPLSFQLAIQFGGLVEQSGLGRQGDGKAFAHRAVPEGGSPAAAKGARAAQITAVVEAAPITDLLTRGTPQAPPPELQALVGWMLSFWTFRDRQDRVRFTGLPLARVLALSPVENGIWLWQLEGPQLAGAWEPEWIGVLEGQLAVADSGRGALANNTSGWWLVPWS